MLLNHVNHKMPIYKDCTLSELLLVSSSYLLIVGFSLASLTGLLFGYAVIGCAVTLLSLVHATRFLLGRLQRLKYGKPYGYYQQLFLKKCSESFLGKQFYHPALLNQNTRWIVRRTIR